MTTAERLRQQGRDQGIEEGMARLLLNLLQLKFTAIPPELEDRVRNASAEEIERWASRVLTAQTLDEVFDAGGS